MLKLLAYIDPGTTALVWQILAGVLIAFGVVLGIWWTKITTFFKSVATKIFGKKKATKDNNTYNAYSEIEEDETTKDAATIDDTSSKTE